MCNYTAELYSTLVPLKEHHDMVTFYDRENEPASDGEFTVMWKGLSHGDSQA